MASVKIDPDFAARLEALGPQPPQPTITTPLEYRAAADSLIGSLLSFPIAGDIIETKHLVTSFDGVEITVHRFIKADVAKLTTPQPALIHAHGGGIVACTVEQVTRPNAAKLVSDSGVQVFAIEYRLAPEFPYPTPVEDCYAALAWVSSHAQELNIDAARIGVFGESGGGGLAAAMSLLARDRGLSPPIAKQILIYPMIDDRATANIDQTTTRGQYLARWISFTDICWGAYLGVDKAGKPEADVPSYASPSRADNLAGLPSTYIDVGSLDNFRDESLAYGVRLAAADVDVELHLYAGLPHIFDMMAPDIPAAKNAQDNRARAIQNI